MPIPSTYPGRSPVIQVSTAGDGVHYPIYVNSIHWNLTTAATCTWALAVTQSTLVHTGTTYAWPVIGSSTAACYLGGSTAAFTACAPVVWHINAMLYGVVVNTLTGGTVQIIRGDPPGGQKRVFTT